MAAPGRPKGIPKTGGRKKGSTNKNSAKTRQQLWEYLDGLGVNPFEYWGAILAEQVDPELIAAMAQGGHVSAKEAAAMVLQAQAAQKMDAAKQLAPYLMPKLSQIEAELGEETRKVLRFRYGKPKSKRNPD